MQEHAVSDQVDQAVAVSRIVCEPDELQIELTQEDLLGPHLGPDGHAPETVAQRRPQYGPPAEHFEQVARRWAT